MNEKIEALLIKRAELTAKIKSIKADTSSTCCKDIYTTCIGRAIEFLDDLRRDNPGEGYSFDEAFSELSDTEGGEACEHCKKVLANKKLRAPIARMLGAVNSALTKHGQRLVKSKNNQKQGDL